MCINGNYPPELLDESGNVDFPTFLPPLSDFILQASLQVHGGTSTVVRECESRTVLLIFAVHPSAACTI